MMIPDIEPTYAHAQAAHQLFLRHGVIRLFLNFTVLFMLVIVHIR